MDSKYRSWFSAFLTVFLMVGFFVFFQEKSFAATGINKRINFQGKVVNNDGTNVTNGSYTFVFTIYDASSAGTNLWSESKSVTVTDGIFQTDLGDTTTLPASIDFNTDNIYLGINFNSDGEMTPRVRFDAVPQAFNAQKVAGLTVTDTTGTLTIPNGKTISFADAFTTSGAFPLTLTSSASTTATLPSGTITLADLATGQTLTNKTIGSTGLVFSGAATDITTGTNEDLTIDANGTGKLVVADANIDLTGGTAITFNANNASNITVAYTNSGAGAANLRVDGLVSCDTIDTDASGNLTCGTDGGAGSTAWDAIGDPTVGAGIAMADTAQTLDWDMNNVTALGVDGLTVTIKNDSATDALTQRAFVVANTDDSASTGTTETIAQIVNRDANETVGTGLLVESTGAGTMTDAIKIAETAGTITNGITIGSGVGTAIVLQSGESIDNTTDNQINLNIGTTGTLLLTDSSSATITNSTGGLTIASNGTGTLTLDPTGAGAIVVGSADVTSISLTTDNNAANDISIAGGVTFNDDATFTLGSGENISATNTAMNTAIDLATFASTLTGDVSSDGLQIAITDNNAASTGTNYALNVVNNDNGANAGVIDGLAMFKNEQQTETLDTGVFIQNGSTGGVMTDGLFIQNISAMGGSITNGIRIDSVTNGLVIGASTDITTSTNESLVIVANGTGTVDIQDALTADSLTLDTGSLTISGVATDITTNTNEDLTLIANGTGVIILNDSVTSGAHTISGATTDITTGTNEALTLDANGTGHLVFADANIDLTGGTSIVYDANNASNVTVAYTNSGAGAANIRVDGLVSCDTIDTDASGNLVCGTDTGAGSSPFSSSGGVITKGTATDFLSLRFGDAADTQLIIENTTSTTIPTADAMQIDLTGNTTGIVTNGVDGLQIAMEVGNSAAAITNSGLHVTMTPINTPSGDENIYGANFELTSATSALEHAIRFGANWDQIFDNNGTLISGAELNLLDGKTGTLIDDTDLTSGDGAGGTSSGSGMETGTGGIGLLQGCAANEILKWNDSTSVWACGSSTYSKFTSVAATNVLNDTGNTVDQAATDVDVTAQTASNATQVLLSYDLVFTVQSTGDAWQAHVMPNGTAQSVDNIVGMIEDNDQSAAPFVNDGGQVIVSLDSNQIFDYSLDELIDGGTVTFRLNTLGYWSPVTTGADLAENYYGDASLRPGDVVSLDENFVGGVRKSVGRSDGHVIGVVSTQPGIVLDDVYDQNAATQLLEKRYEGRVPVAVGLAGRVPVNVSIENGPIKAGDLLSSSSIPGVAMKATKAGKIIGQALFGYDKDDVGAVMMFVNNSYGTGEKLTDIIQGLERENIPDDKKSIDRSALVYFVDQKKNLSYETDLSEIMTDRIAAGLEIITPKVTTQELAADVIKNSLTQDIAFELDGTGEIVVRGMDGVTEASIDAEGNATFSGTVTADTIRANRIEGLEIFTDRLGSLSDQIKKQGENVVTDQLVSDEASIGSLTIESARVTMNMSVDGKFTTKGLNVNDAAKFKGDTLFEKVATFVGKTIFKGDVVFNKTPTFNKDTAGFARIAKGADRVDIVFDKVYDKTPIVQAMMSFDDETSDENVVSTDQAVTPEQAGIRDNGESVVPTSAILGTANTPATTLDVQKRIAAKGYSYFVVNRTKKGFTITLNKSADEDLDFSWVAIAVANPKTFESKPEPVVSPLSAAIPDVAASSTTIVSETSVTTTAPASTVTSTTTPVP